MPATVPHCPPTASTHPNRNMYAFICRLSVYAGGVASLKTCPRAPGQLGALASAGRTANTNSPLGPLGASPDTQGASSDPAPQCIPYTGTPHVCATRGWARKGPWGPEVDALAAACGWVASKPLDRHGLSTPLELKLPQALHNPPRPFHHDLPKQRSRLVISLSGAFTRCIMRFKGTADVSGGWGGGR